MRRILSVVAALALVASTVVPGVAVAQSTPQEFTANVLQGEPDNVDPQAASFATEVAVILQNFEPLLTMDAQLRPQPGSAQSWDISADGRVWTFRLWPGMRFSDGTPVTASNFVYSMQRLLNPRLAAEYASFFVDAGIVGAAEYNSGQAGADALGVRALDDLTVEFTLKQPVGFFPSLMTLWVTSPVKLDVPIDNSSWAADPSTYIGNGPFMMTEWVHQDRIVFGQNPYYVGARPRLNRLTFLMVTDGTADYAAYLAGERDAALVPDANVRSVLADPFLSQEARQYTELTTFWLNINTERSPLNNGLVRKAFARALDREAYINDISQGVGRPTTGIIPPGMPGFDPNAGSDLSFNPASARELLAAAGYSNGTGFPSVTFKYSSNTANQRRAEFIQAQLKQNLNVNIVLTPQESKAYQADFKAKNFDMTFGGWGADYPDPQNWYGTLFTCKGGNNKYNYCNPSLDQLVARADQTTDQDLRSELYSQAQNIVLNDLPVVPIFVRGRMVVVKPYIQGLTITAQDQWPGSYFYDEVSVLPH
ncbi:MAG: peptide ABC transporter substrate-binding protein [Chloroflexi bacterium]|nr:peptide ABC transporter substrate-binding protein [Chloroflexota bacterium]